MLFSFVLHCLVKPEYPSLTISDETIEEEQTVTLTCSSSNGNPAPTYQWFRNGTILTYVYNRTSIFRFSLVMMMYIFLFFQLTESTSICHWQQLNL